MDWLNILEEDDFEDVVFVQIPRQINERMNYFNSFDDIIFFQRFRISKPTALQILELIETFIEFPYDINNSIAPINQLIIFLRLCATGTHLACIADFAGVHLSTVSRIIVRVGRALAGQYNMFIKMPQTLNKINENQLSFYEIARFPRIIGTIDCTHIRMEV